MLLQIFSKTPLWGQVKTRLQRACPSHRAYSADEALIIHQTLLWECLQRFCPFFSLQLWVYPEINHPFLQKCQNTFKIPIFLQQGQDLGERMATALCSTTQPTLLIGADIPSLNVAHLQQAFTYLSKQPHPPPLVFAPTEDGGYCLIGTQEPNAQLRRQWLEIIFNNMTWSTNKVMQQTRERLIQANIKWQELATQWDVDRVEDVVRWQEFVTNSAKTKTC